MSEQPSLENNAIDRMTAAGKMLGALCPALGGIIPEIIGNIIPRQRMDRMADFLRQLDEKVARMGEQVDKARLMLPGHVDLFEDAVFSASRGTTPERIKYLASLVGNSLSPQHVDAARHRRLLWMLDQLNDAEIIMLNSYRYSHHPADSEWWGYFTKHQEILNPPVLSLGLKGEAYKIAAEANAVHDGYLAHLVQLHLLRPEYDMDLFKEEPRFDRNTGMMRVVRHELSPNGIMLLREIDQLPADQAKV